VRCGKCKAPLGAIRADGTREGNVAALGIRVGHTATETTSTAAMGVLSFAWTCPDHGTVGITRQDFEQVVATLARGGRVRVVIANSPALPPMP
jgi:hypothetical protein